MVGISSACFETVAIHSHTWFKEVVDEMIIQFYDK